MSSRDESWTRLRNAAWNGAPGIARMMAAAGASPQLLSQGVASYISDEYSIRLTQMPASLCAEQLISDFARSPNDAVNNGGFNTINMFVRRTAGTPPVVGDIYDIDLAGPVNGSIMTVEQSDGFGLRTVPTGAYFDIQAITTDYGTLPENGAREFGFEYIKGGVLFYTRGVSRGHNFLLATFGKAPQQLTWIFAMKGIRDKVRSKGGSADEDVQRFYKVVPPS